MKKGLNSQIIFIHFLTCFTFVFCSHQLISYGDLLVTDGIVRDKIINLFPRSWTFA